MSSAPLLSWMIRIDHLDLVSATGNQHIAVAYAEALLFSSYEWNIGVGGNDIPWKMRTSFFALLSRISAINIGRANCCGID